MVATAADHSVAAGRIDHVHQHYHAAPRTPVTWPHQVGVIPARAAWFQDRAETSRLARVPVGAGTAVVESADHAPASSVLTGMGGVGKTQLAAHYARTAWQAGALDVLVWITASSRSAVVTGYAQAAVEILGADPGGPEAARAFLAWLEPKSQPSPCRWLVVLDDIADPVDLSGWWPPVSPHGHTLATTRCRHAALIGGGRRLIEIGLFTEAQALAYLTSALAARGRFEPEDQLTALADDLGELPLALSQAAAYLIDAGVSCQAYRGLLADRARSLADAAPDVLPDDQTHAVAAAWSLSLDRADTLRPAGLARPVLQLASAMDPSGFPEQVLTSHHALTYLTACRASSEGDQAERSVSGDEARAALRVLHRLSLIEHSPDEPHPRVRVHQLIQRATRESLSPTDRADVTRSAADSLLATVGEYWEGRVERGDFLANAQAVIQNAQSDLWEPEPHPLLPRFGAVLAADCQFDAALDHFRQLVEGANHRLGTDSRHTLAMRHNLAFWQYRVGDLASASSALEDLLGDAQRVVGPTDHLTLATRRVLANVRGEAGEVSTAIRELAEVLRDVVKDRGATDPFALDVRHNLSYWQGLDGDFALAADGIKEVLSIRNQEIDPERMTEAEFDAILNGLTSLIEQRGRAGDAAGAVDQYVELVEGLSQYLGVNHGTVRSLRTSLAWWKGCSGDISGAITDYTALLDEEEPGLDPHHPKIRALLHNLAYWKGKSGDVAGGIAILSNLLEEGLKELGPNHLDVRLTRLLLTRFHWAAGTILKLPPR
ncbi:hypothetical protein GCM10010300_76320 [Streptomyces olivaceoviridis]|uniref:tetratricopeptide repeat protein n=1 Tax=Streptomyces olivaceoviridis TaxID=1921 RepID=UPI001678CEBA|nr:tetratricopeptide repeat protein [Streptomyces olivaceoviridis]GGZ21329.1 hypothetical protein GCM10010300_76320 [Streptomyces olivaceoviridis]